MTPPPLPGTTPLAPGASVYQQGIGFDWILTFVYLPGGVPFDYAGSTVGAELWTRYAETPIVLTAANGGVLSSDSTTGATRFFVPSAQTAGFGADPQDCRGTWPAHFPTRINPFVIDSEGHRDLLAVLPILVFDPRSVDPSTFPQNQAATVTTIALQGEPGAAGITSVNGYTSSIVTLGAHDVGAYTQAEVDAKIASAVAAAIAALPQSSGDPDDVTLTDAFGQTLGHIAH